LPGGPPGRLAVLKIKRTRKKVNDSAGTREGVGPSLGELTNFVLVCFVFWLFQLEKKIC
jgi:hypothetical protein